MDKKKLAIDFAKSLKHPEIEKILLYGSVARKEDNENSDIDILIITSNDEDELKINDDIYTKVLNILLEKGERISIKIRTKEYYKKYNKSSFLSNIKKDGVLIG